MPLKVFVQNDEILQMTKMRPRADERQRRKFYYTTSQPFCQQANCTNFQPLFIPELCIFHKSKKNKKTFQIPIDRFPKVCYNYYRKEGNTPQKERKQNG